ncbi:hypothetical protein C8R44DRAFT_869159 [Mycena epipterygia]|nr:hypothetical protein C8R44DRAFT_869159 [Mycena epipterygia]
MDHIRRLHLSRMAGRPPRLGRRARLALTPVRNRHGILNTGANTDHIAQPAKDEIYQGWYTTSAPLPPLYSCDWASWCGLDFFVPRTLAQRSDCDALISGACGVPGTIVPVAFIEGALENEFLFVADGIYYAWHSSENRVWRFDRETYTDTLVFIWRMGTQDVPNEAIATALDMCLEDAEKWDRERYL